MPDVDVKVGGWKAPFQIRINGPTPTFRLRSDEIGRAVMRDTEPMLLDLLEIATAVFAADGTVRRGGNTRPDMGADWRREFKFDIPVRHPEFWSRKEVCGALRSLVEFLTEDNVGFRFSQSTEPPSIQPYLDLYPESPPFKADEVILFSGGLDSFAGALEVLATTSSRVVLVSHRSAQKVIPRQVELGRYLEERYPGRVLHIHVLARRKGQEATDTNQRSRSFLFAALGFVVANAFGAQRISFFENGIVSHNLPLSPQIVGTMATRTTHPLALTKMNLLLKQIAPDAPDIVNRFQWLTKSEVVQRINQHAAAPQIARAVSCTSVRDQDSLRTHCGACSQCLDRRFAILAAGLGENDPEEIYHTDVLYGERTMPSSQIMAVEWTRSMKRYVDLDEQRLMTELGLEVTRILEGHPDTPKQTTLENTLAMHRRQAKTVHQVLETALKERAGDLLDARVPATSLVRLLVGSAAPPSLPSDPRSQNNQTFAELGPEGSDLTPGPQAPLQVAFWVEDAMFLVAVQGLCRVKGQPAQMSHGLKSQFDADREVGLDPEEHAFVQATQIPGLEGSTKESVRSAVRHFRKTLSEAFKDVHGEPPSRHLLIQTRPSRGYRLDPHIVVIRPEDLD